MSALRIVCALFIASAGCGARTGLEVLDASTPDVEPPSAEPRIVFTFFDGTDVLRLYVIRADGTGLRRLSFAGDRPVYATFTRDGLQMLYVEAAASETLPSAIVAFDLRTRARRTVLRAPNLSALAVSPDRRTIAYTAGLDLRAVDWDGARDRLLVRGPLDLGCCQWGYGHPAFASDSATVIYSTAGHIERIGVDGARRQPLLTEDFRRIIFPNVTASPDGARIAAGMACGESRALRTYALAALPGACESGAIVTPIEPAAAGNLSNNPAWGASGQIVYQQAHDLFVVDAAGGAPRNLTASLTGGADSGLYAVYPTWTPPGVALP